MGCIKSYNISNVERRLRMLNCERNGCEAYQRDMSYMFPHVEELFRSSARKG